MQVTVVVVIMSCVEQIVLLFTLPCGFIAWSAICYELGKRSK